MKELQKDIYKLGYIATLSVWYDDALDQTLFRWEAHAHKKEIHPYRATKVFEYEDEAKLITALISLKLFIAPL